MTDQKNCSKKMSQWLRQQAGIEQANDAPEQSNNEDINKAIRSGNNNAMNDAIRKAAGRQSKKAVGEESRRTIRTDAGSGTGGSQGVPAVGVANSRAISELLRAWVWHRTVTRKG